LSIVDGKTGNSFRRGFQSTIGNRPSAVRRAAMSVLRNLTSGLRTLFHKEEVEQEMDEELRGFLDAAMKEKMRSGMNHAEALRAARVEMGSVDAVKEEIRTSVWESTLETLWQDVRYGLRQLKRNPGFTAVAVITLALGIGATTAIFTVVNAVLLRPLPYPHPEELVYVQKNLPPPYGINPYAGNREFAAWRNQSRTLMPVAAYMYTWFNLTGGGEPERITCGLATASFFALLGVRPALGRTFLPQEDRPGGPPVAILSYALWKRRFGSDPSVVGRGVNLDDKTYTVVGVLPATFVIPDQYKIDYALWVPLAESETGAGPFRIVRVIGRLKPGIALRTAQSELDTIFQAILRGRAKMSIVLSPWQEQITEKFRLSLFLFLGAVSFLLFIACVNVANLLLSRAATRQKEIAVRLTVGAGRRRIVRQLLTESLLLALLGGILGLALAHWGKDLLVAFISPNLPALEPIGLDYRVLGFSLALAMVTGIAFGLVPALHASGVSLNEVLKEAGRSGAEFRSGMLLRNLLTICETALAMALLVGGGLLFKSFLRVRGIDTGFKSSHILSLTIDLTLSKYPTAKDQARFFQQVLKGIKNIGGVQSVGGSGCPPLGGRTNSQSELAVEGRSEKIPLTFVAKVSPDYFRTMRIPLIWGRYFGEGDREGSPSVAMVNESFARRNFPGEICVGRKVESWVRKNDWLTIVGVVGDVRSWMDREPDPEIYLPYLQAAEPYMTFLVHNRKPKTL
jgi:putative ABC transport system permease protein